MFYSEPQPEPQPPLKRSEVMLIVVLALAWMLPGLVGHEPWKPDEAYNFGLVRHMLESGNWLTFHLPDEAPFSSPPLFFMTAALFGKFFSPLFSLPDAVRLATGFYIGVSLLFVAWGGRILYGKGRYSVLILAGSLGLLGHAHQLIPDSALFAGCAMAICGLATFRHHAVPGGLITGAGICVGFLSKGLVAFAYFLPVLVLLPLLGRPWRNLRYAAFFAAAIVAVMPGAIWPYFLHLHHPQLFAAWWKSSLSPALGLVGEPHRNPLFYAWILPWFAWPTLPLAGMSLWKAGTRLGEEGILLPLVVFFSMLLVLSLTDTGREVYAMPMLIPLALLATSAVDRLKRGATSAFNWFGILTFGLTAGLFWAGWIALMTGHPAYFAAKIHHYHPDFTAHFSLLPFAFALGATILWGRLAAGTVHDGRHAIVNWTGGVVMIWAILMTIWLPFLDSVKGYKEMFRSMQAALPERYGCMEGRHLGGAQRAMLDYYLGIEAKRNGSCDLVLIQTVSSSRHHPEGLKKIWEGARGGDRFERYRLYRRENSGITEGASR